MRGIQHINSMKTLTEFARNFDAKKLEEWIVKSLAKEGQRIIEDAYKTKSYTTRTGNLRDSYVSAVFFKGRLRKDTIRYIGDDVIAGDADRSSLSDTYREYGNSYIGGEVEATTGREEAEKFLNKLQFSSRPSGISLVVAAAMFYSSILEGRGYRVISHVNYEFDRIKQRGYKVDLYNTAIKPEYITSRTIYREDGAGPMKVF